MEDLGGIIIWFSEEIEVGQLSLTEHKGELKKLIANNEESLALWEGEGGEELGKFYCDMT